MPTSPAHAHVARPLGWLFPSRQVPTEYTDPVTGEKKRVGGPHCMRECPVTGDIWTGLKGALKDSPCGKGSAKQKSACCDDEAQRRYMEELRAKGFDTEEPNGWAVWQVRRPPLARSGVLFGLCDSARGNGRCGAGRALALLTLVLARAGVVGAWLVRGWPQCNPKDYDPAKGSAKGGKLYPCLKSPPMLAIHPETGNVYVPQDGASTMLFIDRHKQTAEQLEVSATHAPLPSATAAWPPISRCDCCLLPLVPLLLLLLLHVAAAACCCCLSLLVAPCPTAACCCFAPFPAAAAAALRARRGEPRTRRESRGASARCTLIIEPHRCFLHARHIHTHARALASRPPRACLPCSQVPFPGHPESVSQAHYDERFHAGVMGPGRRVKAGRVVKTIIGKDGKPHDDLQGYVGGWGSDPNVGRITGPAIATAPDGSIWMSLLASYNTLVRIDPKENNKRTLYGAPPMALVGARGAELSAASVAACQAACQAWARLVGRTRICVGWLGEC